MFDIYYSTVRDNFFSNPDLIRKFALSLDMKSDDTGRWPGVRSQELFTFNKKLNDCIVAKILSCYYDFNNYEVTWQDSMCQFQLIDKIDDTLNQGWVHIDGPFDVASVIYLNKNPNPNTGTSLFEIKKESLDYILNEDETQQSEKYKLYKNQKIDKKEYLKQLNNYNSNFVETVNFKNLYNRCITYGKVYHRANSFNMGNDEPRLTLVSFIQGIKAEKTEPSYVRQYNFDREIENVI